LKGDFVSINRIRQYCQFVPCTTLLQPGEGHIFRDQPDTHPYGRALCDKHYAQVMEMRALQRLRKKERGTQLRLPMEES
jgi:hypothetical protein